MAEWVFVNVYNVTYGQFIEGRHLHKVRADEAAAAFRAEYVDDANDRYEVVTEDHPGEDYPVPGYLDALAEDAQEAYADNDEPPE